MPLVFAELEPAPAMQRDLVEVSNHIGRDLASSSKLKQPSHITQPSHGTQPSHITQPKRSHRDFGFEASPEWWLNSGLAFACVLCAAMAAGLTMGFMSFDEAKLLTLMDIKPHDCTTRAQEQELMLEKQWAAKVYPLVHNHHRLLVTLLLFNAAANEALPIFLDRIFDPFTAVLLSVSIVLIFCEVLPSAIFTGENKLKLAASLSCVVWVLLFIAAPIAYPIAKMLDYWLGHEQSGGRYRIPELKSLLRYQYSGICSGGGQGRHNAKSSNAYSSNANADDAAGNRSHHSDEITDKLSALGLQRDEVTIMIGALELKHLRAGDVMLGLNRVFMLDSQTAKMDAQTMADIMASSHSRIVIYDGDKHNVRGLLLVKKLIVLDPESARGVDSLGLRRPLLVSPDMDLLQVLNLFQTGKSHLALVTDNPEAVERAWRSERVVPAHVHMAGILTIEDVLERLLQEDISDEVDVGVVPLLRKARRLRKFVQLALTIKTKAKAAVEKARLAVEAESPQDKQARIAAMRDH